MAVITHPYLWRRDQEVRYGYSGNVLRCWPLVLGEIQDITSPAVSIWRNGALEERLRAMEAREAGAASMMSGLRDEMRTGMRDLKEQQAVFSKAHTELTRSVDRLVGASLVDK